MKDTILFIDSGYLSSVSKKLGGGKIIKYKIEDFVYKISKEAGLNCNEIYFYTAPPYQSSNPTIEENKRRANYDRFIKRLKSVTLKINIREGRLQRINDSFQQKGVDTLMTMDLLKLSQNKRVNEVVIVTADTDFVPIIEDIRKEGLKVILAYFTDRERKSPFSLSNHLWKVVDKKILIRREHFN